MEGFSSDTTVTSPNSSSINSSSPQSQAVIFSPCAACKVLRRRCVEKCVLAPYFPPNDPLKFTTAHRVFGASNIIKLLQELPEPQRADAVSSMVYEANARLRDPIYGCAGAICQLQQQVDDLQEQLAKAKAELISMQCQNANLMALIYMEMSQSNSTSQITISPGFNEQDFFNNFDNYTPRTGLSNSMLFDENNNLGFLYEQSL